MLIANKRWRCKRWYSISYALPSASSLKFFMCGIIWTVFIGCKPDRKQKHVAYACELSSMTVYFSAYPSYDSICLALSSPFGCWRYLMFLRCCAGSPQNSSLQVPVGRQAFEHSASSESVTPECHSKVIFDYTALLRSYSFSLKILPLVSSSLLENSFSSLLFCLLSNWSLGLLWKAERMIHSCCKTKGGW